MVRGVCSGVEMEPSERNRHLQRRRRVGGEGEELRWLRREQRKRGRCRYGVPPSNCGTELGDGSLAALRL